MLDWNDKDDEKFWNFQLYGHWGTDEEMEEAMPSVGALAIILILGILICYGIKVWA